MALNRSFRTAAFLCFKTKPSLWRVMVNTPKIGYGFSSVLFRNLYNFTKTLPLSSAENDFSCHQLKLCLRFAQNHGSLTTRLQNVRSFKTQSGGSTATSPGAKGSKSTIYYVAALGVVALGLSYAAVPLYRIFCQAYSYGGTTQEGHDAEKVETMEKIADRVISVRFNADTAASMTWNFKPQQHEIKVLPGETALAFYTARNPTDRPVIGVSTYNVIPFDAGQYFNKIQCFCFEEQLLNPREEVHMPVFFYIDPEFAADPKMENVDMLTLSYTFFEVREGVQIPIPNFANN